MWKGLGAMLAQYPSKHGLIQSVMSALTVEDAERVICDLFPSLKTLAKVESASNGILVIRAKTSIGMQEVALRKIPIMNALKERGISVRDLRVLMKFEREEQYM